MQIIPAGRQSRPPEELNPKQGEQAIASEKVEQDISQFEKSFFWRGEKGFGKCIGGAAD
jgi:hypothetical protein